MKTVRMTVTIPDEDFQRIEQSKRAKGLSRSAMVHEMVATYFTGEELREKIDKYVDGYRRMPEDPEEIAALEKAQLDVMDGGF